MTISTTAATSTTSATTATPPPSRTRTTTTAVSEMQIDRMNREARQNAGNFEFSKFPHAVSASDRDPLASGLGPSAFLARSLCFVSGSFRRLSIRNLFPIAVLVRHGVAYFSCAQCYKSKARGLSFLHRNSYPGVSKQAFLPPR